MTLPAAERAIYMELSQHLMAQDMKIRKGRGKAESDRDRRLNELLGESKSAEEALLKRCSHFTLSDLSNESENAFEACEVIVTERERQRDDLVRDVERTLKKAFALKKETRAQDTHFDWWVQRVRANWFGDAEATAILIEKIDVAEEKYGPPKKDASKKGTVTKKQDGGQRPSNLPRSLSADEDDLPSIGSDDGSGTHAQQKHTLRELAPGLSRLSTELVSRLRALRYFNMVRQLQLACSGPTTSNKVQVCQKCRQSDLSPEAMSILSLCGHVVCGDCANSLDGENCGVDGCQAPTRKFQILKATELGQEDSETRVGRHYGKKLEAVIDLIINEIPEDEQVLLFAQFDDLMENVSAAFTDHQIAHLCLTKNVRGKAAAMISEFQMNKKSSKKKVLMLNMADESASGANLTNANHIVFLSPLHTMSQYRYDSSMTQAIGRARRYGQTKPVKIYHFLSSRRSMSTSSRNARVRD